MKKRGNKSRKSAKGRAKSDALSTTAEFPAMTYASMEVVCWRNPLRRDPFPQRYRTVFTIANQGFMTAGTNVQRWYCLLNGMYLPFNGGGWINANPAPATDNPTGYSNLVTVGFFQKWRITASRIRFQVCPESGSDTIEVSVTPSFNNAQPSTADVAPAQQFTKSALITNATPKSSQTVINRMSVHTLLGVSKGAIVNDLSGQFYGALASNPANLCYWVINMKQGNNVVSINNIPWRCIVEYEAELWGDSTAIEPETLKEEPVLENSTTLLSRYLAAKEAERKL
jgi:hypothetical protein